MGGERGDSGGGWGWGDSFTGVAIGWLLAPRPRDRAAAHPTYEYESLGGASDPKIPRPVWLAVFLSCAAVGVGYGWLSPEAGFWDSLFFGLVVGFLASPLLILLAAAALFPLFVVWAFLRELPRVDRDRRAQAQLVPPPPSTPAQVLWARLAAEDAKPQAPLSRSPRGRWNRAVADELERLSPSARVILLGGPWWSLLAVAVFATEGPAEWSEASLLFHAALLLAALVVWLGMAVILVRTAWGLVARRRSGRTMDERPVLGWGRKSQRP